ncbi:MAG: STAS domain-containing protein [Ruminiclostridium sp.]|nr:STAS domain-containing protein [Ruminiclostridium sp.]
MTSLTIQKSLENDTYTITVSGRLDTSNSVQFDNESRPCTKDAKKMILDFEHLEYISSSGLRVILRLHKIMSEKGGELVVRKPTRMVTEVLDVTGFGEVLNIEK